MGGEGGGSRNLEHIWLVWFNMVYIIPLIIILSYLTGWWFQPTPLKNMSESQLER